MKKKTTTVSVETKLSDILWRAGIFDDKEGDEIRELFKYKYDEELTSYEIEPDEVRTIKNALDYCHHRIKNHGKGFGIDQKELLRIRKEIGCNVSK